MPEENKALVRRFYEAYRAGNGAALEDIVAANFVSHQNSNPEPIVGLEGIAQHIINTHNDWENVFTIEDMIAEGDKVVIRYTMRGTPRQAVLGNLATVGKQFAVQGCIIYAVAGGKLVERWANVDLGGLWQQVGAVPSQ